MPKVLCKCGHWINLSDIPSPNQMLIISDIEYDKFQGLVDPEKIFMAMHIVAVCSVCGRLYIYYNGFDKPPTIYKKDSTSGDF